MSNISIEFEGKNYATKWIDLAKLISILSSGFLGSCLLYAETLMPFALYNQPLETNASGSNTENLSPNNSSVFSNQTLASVPSNLAPQFSPNKLIFQTVQGTGLSYSKGYSTCGLVLGRTMNEQKKFQALLDLRGHIFNDGVYAANGGVGSRFINDSSKRVFGINLFYDYRYQKHSFNQAGLGVEMLGCYIDTRMNGYLPFGKKIRKGHLHVYTYPGGYIATCQIRHQALPGADLELSTALRNWLPGALFDVNSGLGAYFYHRNCGDNIWGGMFRLGIQYLKHLSLEVRANYDPIFKGTIQGIFTLSFPLGKKEKFSNNAVCDPVHLRKKSNQPIYRNEIIVTKRNCWGWTNY